MANRSIHRPKNTQDGMKVVLTFSISLEQAVKLREIAKKRDMTLQQVIRTYIDQETA